MNHPEITTADLNLVAAVVADHNDSDAELVDTGCGENGQSVVSMFTVDAFVGSKEYGPGAMCGIYPFVEKRIPKMTPSGIVGNSAHTYGYHRARNVLDPHDYSVVLDDDKSGDGWAASAIDQSFPPDLMKVVTARVVHAIKSGDPRARPIREVFGTLDGKKVGGWSIHKQSTGKSGPVTADSSHMWHVHMSIFRHFSNDADAMRGVAEIVSGVPAANNSNEGDTMPNVKDVWVGKESDVIKAPHREEDPKKNPTWSPGSYLFVILNGIDDLRAVVDDLAEKVAALTPPEKK